MMPTATVKATIEPVRCEKCQTILAEASQDVLYSGNIYVTRIFTLNCVRCKRHRVWRPVARGEE